MSDKRHYILEGSLTKGVMMLSTPIVFAMFFQSLLNIVDTFWVGKISAEAVAAVSMSWPVIFILIALAAGISTGCNAMVSRFVGAKDFATASRVAKNSLLLGVAMALVVTAVGLASSSALFSFMGAAGELQRLTISYANIIFYGTVVTVLTFVLGAVLRGEGDTKTPMKIAISVNVLNMVLDPIFIFTLGWGVAGAAWATVTSGLVGLSMYVGYFWLGKPLVKISLNGLEYSGKLAYEVLFIGLPASLRNVTNAIGVFFTIKIVAGYGAAVVAAYGIAFRVESFGVLPVVAIGLSAITMVGQNLGANQLRRAKQSGWTSAFIGAGIMIVFGAAVWIFAGPIIAIFNNEPDVLFHGAQVLKIKAPIFLTTAFILILTSAFSAFSKSHYSLVITIFRVIIMLAMAYWFDSIWGVVGVWWAIALSGIITAIITAVWYQLYQPKPALN